MRPAVFLDRDGVLNRVMIRDGVSRPPDTVDALEILSGVPEALHQLKSAGYRLIVVTNQPDVARGRQRRAVVEAIHERLRALLPCLDEIRVCYHDDADQCGCRKPRPGLLLESPDIDMRLSVMVGDRWRDVEAGRAAGCRTVLVESAVAEPLLHEPDHRAASLSEATRWILDGQNDD